MEESRTVNSIRNIKTGIIVQLINKILAFVVRTFFIKMLNSEYLGINGLFTNILTILSFAELGIGTAIIFNMYKPVANGDHEKIKSLMKLYKKSYNMIGIIVFVLGLFVIPFMDIIIKDAPNIKENLIVIYLLFLSNTSISYLFTYKKSIIAAHQKQRIIDNIDSIFYLIKSILEIIFLCLTKNFIVYLCIQISGTFIENVIISIKADKMYPYLKERNVVKLDKEESKNIFNNVKSLVIYKFGGVIMSGTDNILISMLVNVSVVGLCSNYVLIINSIRTIILAALNGITASVGNLNAVGSKSQKENVFYQITFVNYMVYSFCAIAFIILLNPFIKLWLGQGYVLNSLVTIALSFSFFIEGLRNPGYTYRITLGLFSKAKITPYIGAISNIIFSIIFCKLFGVAGIYMGTAAAQLISYSWIDPYLIHKYEFNSSVWKYYKKYIMYIIAFGVNTCVCLYISKLINLNNIVGFIVNGLMVCLVSNIINVIIFRRSDEFREVMKKIIKPMFFKYKKLLCKKR